jgi:hypothetical protein
LSYYRKNVADLHQADSCASAAFLLISSKRQCVDGLTGVCQPKGTGQEFQVKIFLRDVQFFASFTASMVLVMIRRFDEVT